MSVRKAVADPSLALIYQPLLPDPLAPRELGVGKRGSTLLQRLSLKLGEEFRVKANVTCIY